ncbi:hypothetical protein IT407_03850 [Candidatus Uhrbacteria bacterium]|nr:hypothetical protein [Candidatus Uhrbacteria bacterium]
MASFSKHFSKSPVLLAVIHVDNEEQASENVDIAFNQGADGVFLINHSMSAGSLRDIYCKIRSARADEWIGLNFLGAPRVRLFNGLVPGDASGVWTDNAGYGEAQDPLFVTKSLHEIRQNSKHAMKCLYFGGVSFKHQHDTDNIESACKAASSCVPYVDVITTSGTKTGEPPSVEKIIAMRQAIGKHPLAIASGMTPENVHPFLPHVDAFLVATGISKSFTELDPERVRAMAKIVHGT